MKTKFLVIISRNGAKKFVVFYAGDLFAGKTFNRIFMSIHKLKIRTNYIIKIIDKNKSTFPFKEYLCTFSENYRAQLIVNIGLFCPSAN